MARAPVAQAAVARSAVTRSAVARVERAIRAAVRPPRSRYLAEFTEAFPAYQATISEPEVLRRACAADVILVGDYHSLTPCQTYLTSLLSQVDTHDARNNVLGLEAMYSSAQPILEEWWRGHLDEDALRSRLRFARDWGYNWQPYSQMLKVARRKCQAVWGLDSEPRFDLRRVRARDRHMTARILEMRRNHPKARAIIFVGESHLAPDHLPRLLQDAGEKVFTILQNVDALFWQAQGSMQNRSQKEGAQTHPQPVSVTSNITCVFNASPLEKYESYQQYLDRQ